MFTGGSTTNQLRIILFGFVEGFFNTPLQKDHQRILCTPIERVFHDWFTFFGPPRINAGWVYTVEVQHGY